MSQEVITVSTIYYWLSLGYVLCLHFLSEPLDGTHLHCP